MNRFPCIPPIAIAIPVLGTTVFAASLLFPDSASAAKRWREYTSCSLIENNGNDGDSFHVHIGSLKSASAQHKLFRLYFVDTPESESSLPERLEDQRKYWNLPDAATVVKCGKEAHHFTKNFLRNDFTVYSRLADALGRSRMDRDYAMVYSEANKEDLGYALVRNGLARVSGMSTDLTDLERYGKTTEVWWRKLRMAEAEARKEGRGCWAYSGKSGASNSRFASRPVLPGLGNAPDPAALAAVGASKSAKAGVVDPASVASPPQLPPTRTSVPRTPPSAASPSSAAPASGSLAAATAARMASLYSVPAVSPRDVVLSRSIPIYDASSPQSPRILGHLRAGMTVHVVEALSPERARVTFTLSNGNKIEGAARFVDLGFTP